MSRELNWYQRRELHGIDPLANVVWNEERHVWCLEWDGVKICDLYHSDGSDMVEFCLDEVKRILDCSDNYRNGPERVKMMKLNAENVRHSAMLRQERRIEESIREAEAVARNQRRGCPLQVCMR